MGAFIPKQMTQGKRISVNEKLGKEPITPPKWKMANNICPIFKQHIYSYQQ